MWRSMSWVLPYIFYEPRQGAPRPGSGLPGERAQAAMLWCQAHAHFFHVACGSPWSLPQAQPIPFPDVDPDGVS